MHKVGGASMLSDAAAQGTDTVVTGWTPQPKDLTDAAWTRIK
jgi:hypothetical protein